MCCCYSQMRLWFFAEQVSISIHKMVLWQRLHVNHYHTYTGCIYMHIYAYIYIYILLRPCSILYCMHEVRIYIVGIVSNSTFFHCPGIFYFLDNFMYVVCIFKRHVVCITLIMPTPKLGTRYPVQIYIKQDLIYKTSTQMPVNKCNNNHKM